MDVYVYVFKYLYIYTYIYSRIYSHIYTYICIYQVRSFPSIHICTYTRQAVSEDNLAKRSAEMTSLKARCRELADENEKLR